MADINLLPQELKPNKSVLIIAKKFKKASLIFGSFLILAFLAVIGTQYYYAEKIRESVGHQTDLETQIKSMQDTEQRLVLVKDRVEKIVSITKQGTISEEIDIVAHVLEVLPDGLFINNISLEKSLVQIAVSTNSLSAMSQYINSVTSLPGLKFVNLISFDFNPSSGYTIDLYFIAEPEKTPDITSRDELDSDTSLENVIAGNQMQILKV